MERDWVKLVSTNAGAGTTRNDSLTLYPYIFGWSWNTQINRNFSVTSKGKADKSRHMRSVQVEGLLHLFSIDCSK